MTKKQSFFITIEGGEGVGKTTFTAELSSALRALGISFRMTREPGGTKTADRMRQIFVAAQLDDPLTLRAELLLVMAARAQHVEKLILPSLKEGMSILCDRFADSSRVYQGVLGGVDAAQIETINSFASFALEPHLSFLLDAPIEVVQERLRKRQGESGSETSRFDAKPSEFHGKLLAAYRQVAQAHAKRFVVLDAQRTTAELVAEALKAMQERQLL